LEVELDGQLAGGIYGVMTETIWCGESMFSSLTNGSKMAMVGLCQHLLDNGVPLLDCQLHNPHLQSMGAHLISREAFAQFLP
jgi:leucyl/phenylalanyl-tRNA--protein transferase